MIGFCKRFLIGVGAFFLLVSWKNDGSPDPFQLSFIRIGFGSNRLNPQPAFRVQDGQFRLTDEIMWRYSDTIPEAPALVLSGKFRQSSIDSILHVLDAIGDTMVYRTSRNVMSGCKNDLTIRSAGRKLEMELFNETDSNAVRIVDILNTYLPDERKLGICPAGSTYTQW